MASNPYVNKVQLADGTTLIDLTGDTVAADKILYGYTAHGASGASITGSVGNGTITNNTSGGTSAGTVNRGSQIKIGAGYYASDAYYTAQANSGTKTISTSSDAGTISCDGYENVNITGINIPKPSSGMNMFSVKVPNGSSTITFGFMVDSSGHVIVTEG